MKTLKTSTVAVLLSLCFFTSSAQSAFPAEPDYHKPKIFADLPEKMGCNIHMLEVLLGTQVGDKINLMIAPGFTFQGSVVSRSDASDIRVSSIVIRCSNRSGAVLTFTRISNSDGSFSYNGRILSMKHSDAFEIMQENGQFSLVKKEFNDLLME